MSLIAKIRSRRAIQRKLDEVARIFNSHSAAEGNSAHLGETECAIVTEDGDILTGNGGSPKPFAEIAPKVRRLRASADKVGQCLSQTGPTVVHVRGTCTVVSTYDLGQHTLLTCSEANPGSNSLDTVIARIDLALGVNGDASKLVRELTRLLDDI